ncbi:hypothetical protein [Elizabethkingia anophelis]|uniref:hypothetical protein n=1 Tax=Elizabethkingia anophelis TaxID=1117645 RepID=UPI00301D40B6
MVGTTGKPLIRVVISRDGVVSMFGSKTSGGDLQPLQLFNNSFNNITWNRTGDNTLIVGQHPLGLVYMSGLATGK